MKILATGGTGVIGAAAIPELLRRGHRIRLLSRHAGEDTPAFPPGVEPLSADINDPGPLRGAAAGCDAVLHIAGIVEERPPEVTFQRVNVEGTRHLLDVAAEAGSIPFLFLSSLGADRGESEYHRSKREAEDLVRQYAGPWLILRVGNVYGPGDETISMLLKMVRTLPAVPMVGEGDQPFQPVWFEDVGRAIADAIERRMFDRETLELAGPDVTSTDDVLDRLEQLTDRRPPRLAVPVWLTEVGVQVVEGMGGLGRRLLERANVAAPINASKLSMLIEENVVRDSGENALQSRFGIDPTRLDDGLERLVDLLPEQLPGEGVGAIRWSRYFADIQGARLGPEELIDRMCDQLTEIMPLEFAAEPGVPTCAVEGATLTASIPGRGHIQVRVEERKPTRVTFATLEGHPLAGVVRFEADARPEALRFSIQIASQPANVFDWIAMHLLGGGMMQSANWREVVRRVVELSRGAAPDGVQKESGTFSEEDAGAVQEWARGIVQRQQRKQKETPVESARAGAT